MVLFRVQLNRLYFGIHNKIMGFHNWSLRFNELFHDNRKKWKSMDLLMDLWHSNNVKDILPNFAKDHCFWTFWTLNYVDCIPFSCIDYFQILFLNFRKTWLNLQLSGRGPTYNISPVNFFFFSIYPVNLSIYLSVLLSVMYFSQSLLGGFFKFFAWGCFAIYPKKWQRGNSENCVFCLDNWVNKINLDQKWNIWHFNKGNITFVL